MVSERFRNDYQDEINQLLLSNSTKLNRKVFQWTGMRKDGLEFPIELTQIKGRRGNEIFLTTVVHSKSERKALGELLQRRNRELATVNKVTHTINQSIKLNEVLTATIDITLQLFGLSAGGIYLKNEDTGELRLTANKRLSEDLMRILKKLEPIVVRFDKTAVVKEMKTGVDTHEYRRTVTDSKIYFNPAKMQYVLTLPLNSRARELGIMALGIESEDSFPSESIQLLQTISSQLGIAIENARLFERTSRLSITDELTGLYNRRHFNELLHSEITRSERYGGFVALIILDLDGFKKYNDRYGHISGDTILKLFSQTLRSVLRKTDNIFRYGGDEFTIVLPTTNAQRAKETTSRIRSKWMQVIREQQPNERTLLGFSIGIAQFPEDAGTVDRLTLLADTALYHSKQHEKISVLWYLRLRKPRLMLVERPLRRSLIS